MRLSASKLPLLTLCTWWAQDHVQWTEAGPESEREVGKAFARWSERHYKPTTIELREEFALDDDQVERLERMQFGWSTIIADQIPSLAMREVTFAWDVDTGAARELGRSLDREYIKAGLAEGEIPGTADIAWMDGDCVVIPDIKSGYQGGGAAAALGKAEWQLAFLAFAAAKAWNATRARVVAIRVPDDGDVTVRECELSAEDLRDAEAALREIIVGARDGFEPEPQPGAHCCGMWCSAAGVCPTLQVAVALIPAERLLAQHRLSTDITSDEHLQWTVAVASVVEQGMKAIRNAVTEYTDDHGGRVEFADGSVFERKEIPTERPDLTKPGAEALVLAAGGSAAVDREPTVSWAALERTIGKPATKELRAQMSAAGATKKGSYPKYELVNAKKPRVPRRKREKLPETTGPEAA